MTEDKKQLMVTVFENKYIKAANKDDAPKGQRIPLEDILSTKFTTDAHFVPYISNLDKRLGNTSFKDVSLYEAQATVLVLDIDSEAVHGNQDTVISEEWIAQEKEKLNTLSNEFPYLFYVKFTNGGYKIYIPIKPINLLEGGFRGLYASICAEVFHIAGILADPACAQETRMFRAPYVSRDDGKVDPDGGIICSSSEDILDPYQIDASEEAIDAISQVDDKWGKLFARRAKDALGMVASALANDGQYAPKVVEAFEWVRCQDAAVEGQHGDTVTYNVTRDLVRGFSLARHEALFVLERGFNTRCEPKWDVSELESKIDHVISSAQYPKMGSKLNKVMSRADQPGLTQWLIDALTTSDIDMTPIRPVFSEGSLYCYSPDSGIWEPMSRLELSAFVQRNLVNYFRLTNKGEITPVSFTKATIDAIMSMTESLCHDQHFFKDALKGTAFLGSLARVQDGKVILEPLRAAHKKRNRFDYAWVSHVNQMKLQQYFQSLYPEDGRGFMEVVLTYVGLCMLGHGTWPQLALVLEGRGSNGKSKLMEILTKLFPVSSVCNTSLHDFADEKVRSDLVGKLVNMCHELSHRDLKDTSMLKAIIAGDTVYARKLYQDGFRVEPVAGHIISTNLPPSSPDVSDGFKRRFLVLPMNQNFQRGTSDDTALKWIEKHGAPHLARKALELAAQALDNNKFVKPTWATQATEKWLQHADSVGTFVGDMVNVTEGLNRKELIASGLLYKEYKDFCLENGYKPVNSKNFRIRLEANGIERLRKNTGYFYTCVMISY